MRYKSFEANYLLSLLSAILRQGIPPTPVRGTNWREFFFLGEYHDVASTSYYALIGLYEEIPQAWRERFSKGFRKCVTVNTYQMKEVSQVLKALESKHINCMIMPDWIMKGYYPQQDMRVVEDIEILIDLTDEKQLKKLMEDLGYRYDGTDLYGNIAFFKTVSCRFIFKNELFGHNKRFRGSFSKIWKKVELRDGHTHLCQPSLEDFYILMICNICDRYARETIDIRDLMDIYLFLHMHDKEMNWTYIDTYLTSLDIGQFSKYLEKVSDVWFDKNTKLDDDVKTCRDIEDYILSKGSYGREESIRLLSLITDMEIWQIRDKRKEQIKNTVQWFFPDFRYMEGIFPLLEKIPVLLLFFWIIRLFRLLFFSIKIRTIKISRAVFFAVDKRIERFIAKREREEKQGK